MIGFFKWFKNDDDDDDDDDDNNNNNNNKTIPKFCVFYQYFFVFICRIKN